MIDLGGVMSGDGCRAEPFAEAHRDALRAACAEDRAIWQIYALITARTCAAPASTAASKT